MDLPILIYDISNNQLPQNIIVTNKSIFIRSYQFIGIKIIEGTGLIYSAKLVNNQPVVSKGNVFGFDENFGYTIYLESSMILELWTKRGTKVTINLLYSPEIENINDNYIDKLTNAFLPQYEELLPAILKDNNRNEIMKKLLMDYRSIMRLKGTKKGIEKWLSYVGLEDFKVVEEYLTPNDLPTTTPNKETDRKSGNYYLIIDNSSDDGLTDKNLPKYKTQFEDLTQFFDRLFYAISLANIYFTLPEQDFTFFGINYYANSMKFQSITNRNYLTYSTNPHYFHSKEIDINIIKNYDLHLEYIVFNKRLRKEVTTHSNVMFIKKGLPENKSLFYIDSEVYNTEDVSKEDIKYLQSKVGSIYNLDITAPNKYVEYEIRTSQGGYILKSSKFYIEESINPTYKIKFFSDTIHDIKVTIKIYDHFNNREVYEYVWSVKEIYLNFDVSTSIKLNQGDINLVESPSFVNEVTNNPVLHKDSYTDLSDYYNTVPKLGIDKFLTENNRFILNDLNVNFIAKKVTDLPVKYIYNWLQILAIDITDNINDVVLVSKVWNIDTAEYEFIEINKLPGYEPDLLFSTVMDIKDGNDTKKYLFISTNEQSIDINFIYNLYVTEDKVKYTKIDEALDYTEIKIPVNHDFKLFHKGSHRLNYPTNKDIVIESIFPLLTVNQFDILKLGDVIHCKISENIDNTNILWSVRNAYDNELLFETTDLNLKYRIEDTIVYKIELSLNFNDVQYTKSKIISSYS